MGPQGLASAGFCVLLINKMKISKEKIPLFVAAIMILIASGFYAIKVFEYWHWIDATCEPREYKDWEKIINMPITEERREEILSEIKQNEKIITNCINNGIISFREKSFQNIFQAIKDGKYGSENMRCDKFEEENNNLQQALEKRYEVKVVPDEEARAKSRQEVENYKHCLVMQKSSEKNLPIAYMLILISDIAAISAGVLLFFVLRRKNLFK
jgi:hypothetical protein